MKLKEETERVLRAYGYKEDSSEIGDVIGWLSKEKGLEMRTQWAEFPQVGWYVGSWGMSLDGKPLVIQGWVSESYEEKESALAEALSHLADVGYFGKAETRRLKTDLFDGTDF